MSNCFPPPTARPSKLEPVAGPQPEHARRRQRAEKIGHAEACGEAELRDLLAGRAPPSLAMTGLMTANFLGWVLYGAHTGSVAVVLPNGLGLGLGLLIVAITLRKGN